MNPTLFEVITLWPSTIARPIRRWWYARAEQRYLRYASVEEQIALEAQHNAAHFYKMAVIARSMKIGS